MKRTHHIVVDLFAGGGGASTGIEAALGRPVDVAINHDPTALAVHAANHRGTVHLTADVWEVRPLDATGGKSVELLWASPDCTHFSAAKGGQPRKQKIRSLAWAVTRWARDVRPAIILLENVAEFQGWGPLDSHGQPTKARMGETFRRWKRELERLGYQIDHRVLDASLYGAPTRRRRLFLVARRDGRPIRWPEPTHGGESARRANPSLQPLRTAAECIDWTLPCPSIFERNRPLAEKTLWRIAQGIRRFVLENPEPFIIKVNHGIDSRTGRREHDINDPLTTIVAGGRGHALVTPGLIKVNHGRRESRSAQLTLPLTTVTAARRGDALVAPVLTPIDQRGSGHRTATSAAAPLGTTVVKNRHALIAPTLVQTSYGERPGQRPRYLDLHQPLGTVVAQGQKHALVSAFLAKHCGGVVGVPLDGRPLDTVTAKDHHSAVAATLVKLRGECAGSSPAAPMPTLTAGGFHVAEVRAFLTTYYGEDGTGGQRLDAPARTITAKHRLGLVVVAGTEYQIVDIGLRMLEPHELLRAQFGTFAEGYDLSAARTKAARVRLIGNSVCPQVAQALVEANCRDDATTAAA